MSVLGSNNVTVSPASGTWVGVRLGITVAAVGVLASPLRGMRALPTVPAKS